MTTKILGEFKQRLDGMLLIPSDGGRFEVEIDGELVYSKKATGSFPDENQILDAVRSRL